MATFHTGFSSLGDGSDTVEFERGSQYDFDFIELTMNDYPADDLSADADRIRTLADEHGLELLVHLPHGGRDNMLGSSDDRVREESLRRFKSAVDAAGAIGARKAVLHVDSRDELLLSEAGRFDELCTTVEHLAAAARDHDVELCVENMVGRQRRRLSPRDVSRLVDNTDTSMTFDTGHARTMGYDDQDMAAFVQAHGHEVSHFHLNDTRGAADEHLPFGAGTIDFETIFAALPVEWEGTLTLEIGTSTEEYIEFSHQTLAELLTEIA